MKLKNVSKIFMLSPLALAVAQAAFAQVPENSNDGLEGLDEIIVTGVTKATRKFDATFNINTINEEELKMLAPNGAAQLLGNIPGFFPEGATAGETHNNVLVRGLPQAGGYRYVPNLIDGLPAFEEPEAPFMNNDVFIKPDLMTTSVEAVKGGPGAILYSNALGAAVNYVTRTGTQKFEGGYKLEVGDWGHVRNDFFVSGPINQNLTFAVGGFFRTSDGIRDPGFTANSGGQVRGNLLYTSDDQSTTLKLQAQVIDDKTIFYQNIPFAIPKKRAPGTESNPFNISPDSVQSLGVDFSHGTMLSYATSRYSLFGSDGSDLNLDITDGIHPQFGIYTVDFAKELDDGFKLESKLRYTGGTNGFNALFNDPPTETSRLTGDKYTFIKTLGGNLGAGYADATSVKAYYSDTVTGTNLSTATPAPSILAHNIPVYGKVDATNFTGDFRLTKSLEFAEATHDFTLGLYTSHFTYDVSSVFASAWSSIDDNPRLVDLYAVNASGQQVGASITSGGVDQPALFGLGASSNSKTNAVYILDHITMLDDRLKIDVGARWQKLNVNRTTTNSFDRGNVSNDFTPNDVIVGSTGDTLADNFVNVPDGKPQSMSESYDDVGQSLGANYLLLKDSTVGDVSVYGTVSKSFRLPGFEDYIFGGPATNPTTGEIARGDLVEHINQIEGGVRFAGNNLNLSVSFFHIDFKAKENLGPTLDDLSGTGTGGISCAAVPAPANCAKVRDSYHSDVKNNGFEIEASYHPEFLAGLHLQGSLVLQDPKLGQDKAIRKGIIQVDTNNNGVFDTRQYDVSTTQDRRPQRQSKVMLNFRPSYTFASAPLTMYGQAQYYSERFSSNDSTNVTVYPAYTQFNVGALYSVSDDLEVQLHVDNLNNAESFTEGSSVVSDLSFSDNRYTGVARPLMGRSIKASLNYKF